MRAVAEWSRSGWRTFHWEPWMAALSPAARSAALAEAATWATGLWSGLDWRAFDPSIRIGGPRRPMDLHGLEDGSPQGSVRAANPARAGPREMGPGKSASGSVVDVSVGVGGLGDTRRRLGNRARIPWPLAASLRSPSGPIPERVVGLWPDAGEFRSVDITPRDPRPTPSIGLSPASPPSWRPALRR